MGRWCLPGDKQSPASPPGVPRSVRKNHRSGLSLDSDTQCPVVQGSWPEGALSGPGMCRAGLPRGLAV